MTNPDFDALLANYPTSVQAIAAELRQMIFATLAERLEMVDVPSKLIGYGSLLAGRPLRLAEKKARLIEPVTIGVEHAGRERGVAHGIVEALLLDGLAHTG